MSALCFMITCSLTKLEPSKECTFVVLDVAQGLSQMCIVNDTAVVWDMGSESQWYRWYAGYLNLGSPTISYIVLSHTDEDHRGGLQQLPLSTDFSGRVIVGYGADTALIRSFSGAWKNKLTFLLVGETDTVLFGKDLKAAVLWPPKSALPENPLTQSELKNRYGMCAKLLYKNTSVLITGDLDSISMREIGKKQQYTLQSEILVVPHHGSQSALESSFYGYTNPQWAIISCGPKPNEYGHPSDAVISFLTACNYSIYLTSQNQTITLRSNGFYWESQ